MTPSACAQGWCACCRHTRHRYPELYVTVCLGLQALISRHRRGAGLADAPAGGALEDEDGVGGGGDADDEGAAEPTAGASSATVAHDVPDLTVAAAAVVAAARRPAPVHLPGLDSSRAALAALSAAAGRMMPLLFRT